MINEIFDRYQSSEYFFPMQSDLDEYGMPVIKDEKWHIRCAEHILSYGLKKSFAGDYRNIDTLRAYNLSQQSIAQYLPQEANENVSSQISDVNPAGTISANANYTRKALHNLFRQIQPVWESSRIKLKRMLMERDSWIDVYAIDFLNTQQKENVKNNKKNIAQFPDLAVRAATFFNTADKQTMEQIQELADKDEDEIDAEIIKLPLEIALQLLCEYTFNASDWKTLLKDMLLDEALLPKNHVVLKLCTDYHDNIIKIKVVDLKDFVIQASRLPNYEDSEFCGYIRYYRATDFLEKGYSADDVRGWASLYVNTYNNPDSVNQENYKNFTIPVFEAEWISQENEYIIENDNPHKGHEYFKPDNQHLAAKEYRRNQRRSEKVDVPLRTVTTTTWQSRRQCAWVIGTTKALEFGLVDNMMRDSSKKKTYSQYICVGRQGNSIIQSIKSLIDRYMLVTMQFLDEMSTMKKSFRWYNMDWLEGALEHFTVTEIPKLIELFEKSGRGGGKPKSNILGSLGDPGNNSGKPIDYVPSEMSMGVLEGYWRELNNLKTEIMSVAGLDSPIFRPQASDQPVAQTELMNQGSFYVVDYFNDTINLAKTETAKRIISTLKNKIKFNKDFFNSYRNVLEDKYIKAIKDDDGNADYAFLIRPRATQADMQEINQQIQISLTVNKDGLPQITTDDAFVVRKILQDSGDIDMARYELEKRRSKREKEKQANTQANQEQATKLQQERDATLAELEIRKNAMLTEMEQAKNQQKYDLELRNAIIIARGEKEWEAIKLDIQRNQSLQDQQMQQGQEMATQNQQQYNNQQVQQPVGTE